MIILQRYIAVNLMRGWLLVLLVLGAVFGLIGFIGELEHTDPHYNVVAVVRYTLLTLPQQLLALLPVIALLGSIVALADLNRYNELTVLSCAGLRRRSLLLAIAHPTLLFMALLWPAMEYVTAPLQQYAERQRQALLFDREVRLPDGGIWSKNGRRYLHLGKLLADNSPGDIQLYQFAADGSLLRAVRAARAEVGAEHRWRFRQVREKYWQDGRLLTRELPQLTIAGLPSAAELPTLTLAGDSMALSALWHYSTSPTTGRQLAQRYRHSFWQQLLTPCTAAAMVLLATPIGADLGSRRERNFGVNMTIGAFIGILFYPGTQIIFALGQLFALNAPLVAASPALLVLCCALCLLRRMRW